MNLRLVVVPLVLVSSLAWCAGAPRPNIILIVTDDHAQRAMSCYGGGLVETPHLDAIAQHGVRFSNSFVTNSICAPSRASILTGLYSHRNGVMTNREQFDSSLVTFPKLLHQAGYQTAMIGKWHLKSFPTGFDRWAVLVDQGEYYNPRFIVPGDTIRRHGYATTLITDMAIETLEERDTTRPFCLLYWHKAPHRNWLPDIKDLDLFDDRHIPVPPTFHDDYSTRSAAAREQDMRIANMYDSYDLKIDPSIVHEVNSGGNPKFNAVRQWELDIAGMTPDQRDAIERHYAKENAAFADGFPSDSAKAEWKYERFIKDYLRCVVSVDENIGRLQEYLAAHKLSDNTVIIYTSDQGFYLGEHGWFDKRFMYEESMRTPLLIEYPALAEKGSVCDAMVLNIDLAPTILDLCGVAIPGSMQGRSLRPLLSGTVPGDWRSAIYYHYSEYPAWHDVKKHYGIRTDRFKLIHFYDDIDAWELYDLARDPHELHNLFSSPGYDSVTTLLKEQLEALRTSFGDR
jgi:arylsulfatase A-like enzyme